MNYEVWIDVSSVYRLVVDAENRDEAIATAKEMARDLVRNNHAITYDVVEVNKLNG